MIIHWRGSAADRLLVLRIRIPPGAWISDCRECYVVSGRDCLVLVSSSYLLDEFLCSLFLSVCARILSEPSRVDFYREHQWRFVVQKCYSSYISVWNFLWNVSSCGGVRQITRMNISLCLITQFEFVMLLHGYTERSDCELKYLLCSAILKLHVHIIVFLPASSCERVYTVECGWEAECATTVPGECIIFCTFTFVHSVFVVCRLRT
jgi:hypothetical protein